ncbi:MAG: helix-turn-helix transcriptional regulator [Lachnospiraceae bacterium]|nr:helix-turn-helix transcriptional regulator [Lachnospiraceae bacterium]
MESRIPCDYVVNSEEYNLMIETISRSLTDGVVDQLYALRKQRKLTQQDIADATGMKRANIARIERKRYAPSMESLVRYAESLGVKLVFDLVKEPVEEAEEMAGRAE